MYENLFHKGKIGRLELKNRFVMPPMDSGMTEENGEVSERLIAYYAARAKGSLVDYYGVYICRLSGWNGKERTVISI